MFEFTVFKFEMASPDDTSGLKVLFDTGKVKPQEVIAVLAKTEGNGCVNDFTRGYSTAAFKTLLAAYLGTDPETVEQKVAFVMSGGTEGVLTPHATVFCRKKTDKKTNGLPGLSIGVSFTREFLPEELGTLTQVFEVAQAVEKAMVEARIKSVSDVHFVQIKCPLLTTERILDARERGKNVVVDDTYKSMGYSRGASALGVALATGEIERQELHEDIIAKDWTYFSSVASTSAGVELLNCEIILMGNSNESVSDFRIGHGVMKDCLDLGGLLNALRSAGLEFKQLPSQDQIERIVNVFAKAEADPSGYVRGKRHTMMTDSDINHTRHARAVVGGVIGAVVSDPAVYVSGGAEHQGPAGGGPVAVIVKK
jgi:cyanuric acid amidohydrolase